MPACETLSWNLQAIKSDHTQTAGAFYMRAGRLYAHLEQGCGHEAKGAYAIGIGSCEFRE